MSTALSFLIARPAAAHDDDDKQRMTMPGGSVGQDATADTRGYIKVPTPAGNEAFIGRKNSLTELEPEIVNDGEIPPLKVFRFTVEDVEIEIHPGKTVKEWGFNGLVPGPVLRVREGDRVRIVLTNNTKEQGEHTVHVHSQRKPLGADGVPLRETETPSPSGSCRSGEGVVPGKGK